MGCPTFYIIPDETARSAHAAVPNGTLCLAMRDERGPLYENRDVAHLCSSTGQPTADPARVAFVTVMPLVDGPSDRQAADAVRDRMRGHRRLPCHAMTLVLMPPCSAHVAAVSLREEPNRACAIRCCSYCAITACAKLAADISISVCAVLLAEACIIGLAPLVNPNVRALTSDRLTWVQQNSMCAEPLTRANACLVDAQSRIPLAQAWGGGEVASADGPRFVVPVRTINAASNRTYFARGRGLTYDNLVSDQFTGLNGIVATGTLRDSLVILSLRLGQQTILQPKPIMTDTGAYSDVMFALFWALDFQFSPRLSDVGGAWFWRIDPRADYGPLNVLARHTINLNLITEQWDEIVRLTGSLATGTFHVESLIRTLQRNDRPTRLARAVGELGRIIKTIYLREFVSDEAYRRRVLNQLNRREGRHSLARTVFHGQRGEGGARGPVTCARPGRQHHCTVEHDLSGPGA